MRPRHWSCYSYTHPAIALTFISSIISLAGLPPVAGFIGKVGILLWSLNANLYALTALVLITTSLGAVYYFRIIRINFAIEPKIWTTQHVEGLHRSAYNLAGIALAIFAGVLLF